MTVFWIVVLVMIAGALAFLLLPLLKDDKDQQEPAKRSEANLSVYRDQVRELDADLASGALDDAQYRSARAELERRALEDAAVADEQRTGAAPSGKKWIIAAIVAVPLLTISLYFLLGKPGGSEQPKEGAAQPQLTQAQIEERVAALAKKLEANPNDAQGWAMLGRSYAFLRRFDESGKAYARAEALAPDNATILIEYADILAYVNGRNVLGEPEKLVLRTLQIEPNNIKALALAGTASFQRKDYRHAIEWWKKILPLVPPDSPMARSVNANISQAQGLSGQPAAGGAQAKK